MDKEPKPVIRHITNASCFTLDHHPINDQLAELMWDANQVEWDPTASHEMQRRLGMAPDKTITIQTTMVWHPVSDPPKKVGWYAGAILPVNWKSATTQHAQGWREEFGFAKVWYNHEAVSPWWVPRTRMQNPEELGDRITHYAELPPVPPFTGEEA
jgi:hypothetical protein